MEIRVDKISKSKKYTLLFDEISYALYVKYNWSINHVSKNNSYLVRKVYILGIRKTIRFHRELLEQLNTISIIDHKNRNSLDNRLCNLRIASKSENGANARKAQKKSSKYIGVHLSKKTKKWLATIGYKNKMVFLGEFISEHAAGLAYNIAAKQFFKAFANLNKIKA